MAGIKKIDAEAIIRNAERESTFDLIKSMNKKQLDELMKKSGIKKGVSGAKSIAGGLKKGGRVDLKSGGRVCKIAKRGKGKAYGKNS
jgi:hypothetical protein